MSLSTIGREWREMSPKKKARYQEDYQRRLEEYQKQMKKFSHNFATKKDQRVYFLSIKEQRKLTAFSAMVKDRASKLPREERRDYMLHKSQEDYKNLTSSELQTYQHMADNINKENKKYHALHKPKKVSVYDVMFGERTTNRSVEVVHDYKKKAKREFDNLTDTELRAYEELADIMSENNWHKCIDRVFCKPRRISARSVMRKERAAKLPKEDRVNYLMHWSIVEYKNLSAVERQAYQKMADDLNKKRIKIHKIMQRYCNVV